MAFSFFKKAPKNPLDDTTYGLVADSVLTEDMLNETYASLKANQVYGTNIVASPNTTSGFTMTSGTAQPQSWTTTSTGTTSAGWYNYDARTPKHRPITPDEHEVMISLGFEFNVAENRYELRLSTGCHIPLEEIMSKNNVTVETIVDNYLKEMKQKITDKIKSTLILNKLAKVKGPENENEKQ
jgi:hypothetical protein